MTKRAKGKGARTPDAPAQTGAEAGTAKLLTSMAVSGSFNGMAVIQPFQKNLAGDEVTADALVSELRERLRALQSGDMTHVESMLLSQATALQTVFASLARRAAGQEYLKQYQTFLTLALKAQAQSRATLEALIELKHPRHPPTFVKQANIAHGPQQVNNGERGEFREQYAQAHAHAEKAQTAPNKLLESPSDERMDIGAQATTGRGHQVLEPVGGVDRTQER